jgi:TPR repeat protein
MELQAEKKEDASARLIAAGRALLAQGDARFSLSRLCADAGVTLEEFRASFASKAALLQQLMEQPEPVKAEAPAADPWLERRLRVFERALTSLEEKADRREREARQTIALLEEKLAALGSVKFGPVVQDRRSNDRGDGKTETVPAEQFGPPAQAFEPAPEPAVLELAPELAGEAPAAEEASAQGAGGADAAPAQPNPLLLGPLETAAPARLDPEFLEAARRAAQAHAQALESARPRRKFPLRLLVASALAALTLLAFAALTLVRADYAAAEPAQGTSHRAATLSPLQKLLARADSGEPKAEKALALAYLRGDGVPKDLPAAARWAGAAAEQGDAEAQYLMGNLTRDGAGVPRDPVRAFAWFAKAAAAGEVKAMHNLAIAYVEGAGTAKDDAAAASWFARAAARGYVDAAFDLAVMFERGQGVKQDARTALQWYQAAAAAGDTQAAERARLLKDQAHL